MVAYIRIKCLETGQSAGNPCRCARPVISYLSSATVVALDDGTPKEGAKLFSCPVTCKNRRIAIFSADRRSCRSLHVNWVGR